MMFVPLMLTAALVGSASASFSQTCISTLTSLSSDSNVVGCLNPTGLLPILMSVGSGGQGSLISSINTWLQGTCASPACSNETLASVMNNLTSGCSAEFGLPQNQASQTVSTVQTWYPTVRKVACLANGNTLCVTSELNLLEPVVGPISLNQTNVNSILLLAQFGFTSNVTCTDCVHGALTIINQDLPGVFSQANLTTASNVCGPSFLDNGIPPSLVQTAVGVISPSSSTSSQASSTTSAQTAPQSTTTAPSSTKSPTPSTTPKSSALGRSSTNLSAVIFATILICTFAAGV